LAKTYAAFSESKVAAYITLVCGEITLEGNAKLLDEPDLNYNYKGYPSVKIARLAVDTRHRGADLGSFLVKLALGIATDRICPAIGCRFVSVDAKKESVGFYLKQGFTLLDTPDNKRRNAPVMFIDLHKAK
jgi:GNAT superfamily N-acetyltransferase